MPIPDPLPYGAEVVFTAAGGVGQYTFELTYDDNPGALTWSGNTAVYKAPLVNTVNFVWVYDQVGTKLRVKVRVNG